jgi:hypothetical protein
MAGFVALSLSWAMVGSVGVGILFGAVSAVALAIAQWLVLRWAVGVSAWWVLATTGGVAFMHGLGDPLGDSGVVPLISVTFGLVAVIGGAVIGTLQFLLLRTRLLSAERWIAVSAASWALGVMAGSTLVTLTDMDRSANRDAHAIAGAVAGVIVGAITGTFLSGSVIAQKPMRPESASAS